MYMYKEYTDEMMKGRKRRSQIYTTVSSIVI